MFINFPEAIENDINHETILKIKKKIKLKIFEYLIVINTT